MPFNEEAGVTPELRQHLLNLHQMLTDWQLGLIDLVSQADIEGHVGVNNHFLGTGKLNVIVRNCSGLTQEVYKALLGVDQGVDLPFGNLQRQIDQGLEQHPWMQNETGRLRTQPIAASGVYGQGYR